MVGSINAGLGHDPHGVRAQPMRLDSSTIKLDLLAQEVPRPSTARRWHRFRCYPPVALPDTEPPDGPRRTIGGSLDRTKNRSRRMDTAEPPCLKHRNLAKVPLKPRRDTPVRRGEHRRVDRGVQRYRAGPLWPKVTELSSACGVYSRAVRPSQPPVEGSRRVVRERGEPSTRLTTKLWIVVALMPFDSIPPPVPGGERLLWTIDRKQHKQALSV